MKRKTREEKAITLIALIITIVVLLILAVVAINAVTGDGIIQHAVNAKEDYEKAQAEENSMLSYYETYLQTEGTVGKWIQTGETVERINANGIKETIPAIKKVNKDGTVEVLAIGDYVNYNPLKDEDGNDVTASYTSYSKDNASSDKNNGRSSGTGKTVSIAGTTYNVSEDGNQTFNVGDYGALRGENATWQVLGIENGQLLLVSTRNISEDYFLYGVEGYKYIVDEMNAIASIYGNGKGAQSARSINSNDIDKITGYKLGQTEKFGSGKLGEYGNNITFSYTAQGINWTTENNVSSGGVLTAPFYYLDNYISKEISAVNSRFVLTNNMYRYFIHNLSSDINSTKELGIPQDSIIYDMLFNEVSGDALNAGCYLLASRFQSLYNSNDLSKGLMYGIDAISEKSQLAVKYSYGALITGSSLKEHCVAGGIRAVVKLKPNVKLIKNGNVWNIK